MAKDSKAATLKRLSRIEGQVRGLARISQGQPLLHRHRYADSVRSRAALRRGQGGDPARPRRALRRPAIKSGNKTDQRRKVAELMDVMGRAAR